MIDVIYYLYIAILLIVVSCYLTYLFIKSNEKQNTNTVKSETKVKRTKGETNANVIDALDWMLANNIIDTNEYQRLLVKSLPFLE